MTAEIALMNRDGIALAADSAQTTSTKIFNTAVKIFALSKRHPVGMMIYGNASFMGIPCETIIKMYSDKLGGKPFDTLEEYAKSFINFLDKKTLFFLNLRKMSI